MDSVKGRGPGGGRNGLPERRGYRYRGSDADVLTGHLTLAELEAAAAGTAVRGEPSGPAVREELRGPDPEAEEAESEPLRLPPPVLAPVPAVRSRLFIPGPAAGRAEVPGPEEPPRCRRCRYVAGSPGCRVSCGDGP